jgi:chromosome partitioning protein
MRRIAMVCQKGGCSKTTTATALAVGLARRGHKVLCVDADQQANATWTLLGGQGGNPPTLAAVLMRQAPAGDAIRPTRVPGLDLLPADATLGGVNVTLAQCMDRDIRLREALAPLDGRYDFALLDTGPQFTTTQANVLVYTSEVIVPLDPGVYAVLGLVELQETIALVRRVYANTDVHLAGLALTKMQRNNVARDVEAELRQRFGGLVFQAIVPLSAKVEEACTRGLTIGEYAPKSAAALAYDELVREVIDHGDRATERGGIAAVGGPGAEHAA